jgi:hypothetical protein
VVLDLIVVLIGNLNYDKIEIFSGLFGIGVKLEFFKMSFVVSLEETQWWKFRGLREDVGEA